VIEIARALAEPLLFHCRFAALALGLPIYMILHIFVEFGIHFWSFHLHQVEAIVFLLRYKETCSKKVSLDLMRVAARDLGAPVPTVYVGLA